MSQIKREITPVRLRCQYGQCQSLHELQTSDVAIVGKNPTPEQIEALKELGASWGEDSRVLIIGREYFAEL